MIKKTTQSASGLCDKMEEIKQRKRGLKIGSRNYPKNNTENRLEKLELRGLHNYNKYINLVLLDSYKEKEITADEKVHEK